MSFTLKLYGADGATKIVSAGAISTQEQADGSRLLTLSGGSEDGHIYHVGPAPPDAAPGLWFARAIVENEQGHTTEIIRDAAPLGPRARDARHYAAAPAPRVRTEG